METKEHRTGWDDFADLLALIRNLFGDALKASEPLAARTAESASRWLRAAEAFARVLLLTMARAVVLTPTRTAGAVASPAVQAEPPHAGETPAVRTCGSRSLFTFSRSARRRRAYVTRAEMTIEQMRAWYFFGGKEAAAERKAQRLAEDAAFVAQASSRQRRELPRDSAPAGGPPALRGVPTLPRQANLIRRYNALVRIFEAPDKAAQRLARRLTIAPGVAQRILASATPRERWRSGYDDTIRQHASAAAVSHDSS